MLCRLQKSEIRKFLHIRFFEMSRKMRSLAICEAERTGNSSTLSDKDRTSPCNPMWDFFRFGSGNLSTYELSAGLLGCVIQLSSRYLPVSSCVDAHHMKSFHISLHQAAGKVSTYSRVCGNRKFLHITPCPLLERPIDKGSAPVNRKSLHVCRDVKWSDNLSTYNNVTLSQRP
jgi:hypothetical protein